MGSRQCALSSLLVLHHFPALPALPVTFQAWVSLLVHPPAKPASSRGVLPSSSVIKQLGHSFGHVPRPGWGSTEPVHVMLPGHSRLAPHLHGAGPCTFAREIPATLCELQLLGSQLGAVATKARNFGGS